MKLLAWKLIQKTSDKKKKRSATFSIQKIDMYIPIRIPT